MTTRQRIAISRFKLHIEVAPNGCWLWTGLKDQDGYGRHRPGLGKNYVRAHRFAWTLKHGPIPQGLHVLHKCDTRACVNDEHLFLGTNRNNIDDMVSKGRAPRGDKHWRRHRPLEACHGEASPCAKLTDQKVMDIRLLRSQGKPFGQIAKEYGVAKSTIQRICNGQMWKHVSIPTPH